MFPASRGNSVLWALSLALLLLASVVGRPDIPIDETRYVSVAWEAWLGGDWLVMHMNGQPYHHKPPLLFWLIGLGWSVFGVSDWWPRAISALSSLACVLLIGRIGSALWPERREVPESAGWLLLTSLYWLLFSTSVMFDILLAACTLAALVGVLDAWRNGGWRGWLWCGIALGLGVLAKGPFVLLFVIPVIFAGPWWGGERARGRQWWRGAFAACALGAVIALLWIVPAAIFGGEEFRNAILWRQVAGRVSGELAHRQPVWFYLPGVLALFFPLVLSRHAWDSLLRQAKKINDPGTRLIICWTLPSIAALSLSGGKQIHYILPLWPALVLLLAAGWGRVEALGRKGLYVLPMVVAVLGLALLISPLWAGKQWFAGYAGTSWMLGGGLLVMLAIGLVVFSRRENGHRPSVLAIFSLLVAGSLLLFVIRPLAPAFDMTPMAMKLKQLEADGVDVVHVSAYNDQFHYYGKLERPLRQIGRDEIESWFAEHPESRAVVYLKNSGDLAKLDVEFSQPYLSGAVALIAADSAKPWITLWKTGSATR